MTDGRPTRTRVPAIEMTGVAVSAMRDLDTVVAENINWTVSTGDYWVVAGLHGSGKSDFLMLTGGLMGPRRGRYLFFGEEMPIFEGARLKERLRLGLVFDGGQLFNHLTVAENVALPLRYHRNLSRSEGAAAVGELLDTPSLRRGRRARRAHWGAVGRNAPAWRARWRSSRRSCWWIIPWRAWIRATHTGGWSSWINCREATL